MSMKILAGAALALSLLGFVPASAAPAAPASLAIERADVAPLVELVHSRQWKHRHRHVNRRYYGGRTYYSGNRGYRPYGYGYQRTRPGVYLNFGGNNRGYSQGYSRSW